MKRTIGLLQNEPVIKLAILRKSINVPRGIWGEYKLCDGTTVHVLCFDSKDGKREIQTTHDVHNNILHFDNKTRFFKNHKAYKSYMLTVQRDVLWKVLKGRLYTVTFRR